jgi:hypothetical protein
MQYRDHHIQGRNPAEQETRVLAGGGGDTSLQNVGSYTELKAIIPEDGNSEN